MSSTTAAPQTRKTFSRLKHVLELPNLIDIQKASFKWFLEEGLRETIDDISPIEDYTGNLAVQFGEFTFDNPVASLDECREKDLTYARPLTVTVGGSPSVKATFCERSTASVAVKVTVGEPCAMTVWPSAFPSLARCSRVTVRS